MSSAAQSWLDFGMLSADFNLVVLASGVVFCRCMLINFVLTAKGWNLE